MDEFSPDLIIMDLNMPHFDGLMTTERIRQFREKQSRYR